MTTHKVGTGKWHCHRYRPHDQTTQRKYAMIIKRVKNRPEKRQCVGQEKE